MPIVIVGLGNPGNEYAKTRHNAGRMVAELFIKEQELQPFAFNKKANAQITEGIISKQKVQVIAPDTFMNNSGKSLVTLVKSKKAAADMLVIRDDLDLPIGAMKMKFGGGSGGHKGVESIMRLLKTDQFAQLKIGISGSTPKGNIKKVSGTTKVNKHVVGKFSPKEEAVIKKMVKKASRVAEFFVTEGMEKAIQEANTK